MTSRAEQKARTRKALVGSVLRIVGDGANFASVSLREVAKTAGVVPTSFYRHFGDMDELGLAVVDQLGLDLRRIMRGSFDPDEPLDELVNRCVTVYQDYVLDNADLVRFVDQARTGGKETLRTAIGHELDFFSARIAGGLRDVMPGLKPADRDTVSELIMAVLLDNITSLLALPRNSTSQQDELRQKMESKLHVILLGAAELGGAAKPKRKRASRAQGTTTAAKASTSRSAR
jgi:TetR/AcrR family transcriptional regulator, fatty acid biosynthesis regulator